MDLTSKLPRVGTTIFTVMSQLAAEHKAINLGQGFPDFPVPAFLVEELHAAMRAGHNQYAPMTGIPALRQQIARKIAALYDHSVDADAEVTVTSGATEAIFAAVHALVRADEEVIVLDPCYDCYEPAIELAGARTVHVPLAPPAFNVDWDRVRAAVTPRTRMIIVNTPHNPCGAAFSPEDLEALASIVRDSAIVVLSDEVYEHIVFDGRTHQSVLRHTELAERSIVVSSFGKTYHCTGWKVGYAVAPAALSTEFRKVHQYLTFCTFNPAQHALAAMMERHPQHHEELPAFYQDKRDRFRRLLEGSRFVLPPVAGSYFQLADYSAISDSDDVTFARWLTREHGVATIPLSPFYDAPPHGQRLVRMCFAKDASTLEAAAERLRAV
jgi:methionine aminotransferase